MDSRLCLGLDVENQLETRINHAPTVGQDLQQGKFLTKQVALLVCKDRAQQETCVVLRIGRNASTHHLQCTVADVCLDERWCREVGKKKGQPCSHIPICTKKNQGTFEKQFCLPVLWD